MLRRLPPCSRGSTITVSSLWARGICRPRFMLAGTPGKPPPSSDIAQQQNTPRGIQNGKMCWMAAAEVARPDSQDKLHACCRRLIYCPQSEWDPTQLAIYLTPVASQQAGPGWLRHVSFNMRIYGHDDPTQSIWASEFTRMLPVHALHAHLAALRAYKQHTWNCAQCLLRRLSGRTPNYAMLCRLESYLLSIG